MNEFDVNQLQKMGVYLILDVRGEVVAAPVDVIVKLGTLLM